MVHSIHAAIVARALAIPLVIHAERITNEALNGDLILVDGDQGVVHLRPDETVVNAFRDKMAMAAKAPLHIFSYFIDFLYSHNNLVV